MISGKVLSKEIDQNGNIKVHAEYTLTDGSKVQGATRYNCFNYSEANVLKDVKTHCETLMRKTYNLKQSQEIIATPFTGEIKYDCSSLEITTKPAVLDKDSNVITPAEKITIDDN